MVRRSNRSRRFGSCCLFTLFIEYGVQTSEMIGGKEKDTVDSRLVAVVDFMYIGILPSLSKRKQPQHKQPYYISNNNNHPMNR